LKPWKTGTKASSKRKKEKQMKKNGGDGGAHQIESKKQGMRGGQGG